MKTTACIFAAMTLAIVDLHQPLAPCAHAQSVDVGSVLGAVMQGVAQAEMMRRQRQFSPPPGPVGTEEPDRQPRAYTVDGYALGDRIRRRDDLACRPSEQFVGATWCHGRRQVKGILTTTSILLGGRGDIQYYNKFYESAVFQPDAIVGQIEQLSADYRQKPRILRMPRGAADSDTLIAVWGDMLLTSVDLATMEQLMADKDVNAGFIIDYLGSPRESARGGLPVFRIAGGPGYYWEARYDKLGHGQLRFGMANANLFDLQSPNGSASATAGPIADRQAAEVANAMSIAQQAATERKQIEAQQDEARRAKLAEEQAAGDAAAERLKADHLARAADAARRNLQDATGFVQSNRDDPKLETHLQHITDLNTALAGTEPTPIEQKSSVLMAALSDDPAYAAYAARRAEERRTETERDLTLVKQDLQLKRKFLIDAVAQEPTSPSAATLLTLANQVDPTIAAADLPRALTLVGQIDEAIRAANLSQRYELAKRQSVNPDGKNGSQTIVTK